MNREEKYEKRVDSHMESRLEDIRTLWDKSRQGDEEASEEFNNYGLCFDYLPAGTYNDQEEAFFRWQLSWGGPGDEFRFYVNPDLSVHRIEYWFLDWFDGAHRVLRDADKSLLCDIWEDWKDCETPQYAMKKALED